MNRDGEILLAYILFSLTKISYKFENKLFECKGNAIESLRSDYKVL